MSKAKKPIRSKGSGRSAIDEILDPRSGAIAPRRRLEAVVGPRCKQCGEPIPETRKRGRPFGGQGRPREFCVGWRGANCRQRWRRAQARAEAEARF